MKPNGYVLFQSAWIVAIATGFTRKSANRKTGPMIQVWILNRNLHPVLAQKLGKDKAVCGNCPQRPALGGDCYVNAGQAPASVWKAYQAGSYPVLPSTDVFAGRLVRFGAYGDPTKIPLGLLRDIASKSTGFTGYTHQWRNPLLQGYRDFLMASADSPSDQIDAVAQGWRTFRVAPKGSTWRMADEISCPASKEAGERVQCARCRLCAGQSKRGARNIVIQQH